MKSFTELNSWSSLDQHAQQLRLWQPTDFKKFNALGFELFTETLTLNYSRQRLDETALTLLLDLAKEQTLPQKITALINGDKVNLSENRAALHTALRRFDNTPLWIDNKNITSDILNARSQMYHFAEQIRKGEWLGFTGQPIKDIVNIGIGGSDFGPRFCIHALAPYAAPHLNYHFISDIDPLGFEQVTAKLNPESTLFIISSKSFTTQETLYNAKKAFAWLGTALPREEHFIAITANTEKARELGFKTILPIWKWVGGRYSMCSAINLITCIAIGENHFSELLAGAHAMDNHFHERELYENMPVILALIGIWNINFLHISNLLLLVYAKQLELLVPYIQQLDMESNGKSMDTCGRSLNYATGPIVWGGLGNQAQHSYYQLLCQGTHKITTDFITTNEFEGEIINQFCQAKMRVLNEGILPQEHDHQGYIAGGMPMNHLQINTCSPFAIGSLIALYEHKIYVQGVIWNINSFDQPGVESAKRLHPA